MGKSEIRWVRVKTPIKINITEKERIKKIVEAEIESLPKIREKLSRVEVRAGRVYLYELVEQFLTEGAEYIKPLIEGKYLEYPMGRITVYDKDYKECTLDWQRHNNQWMTLEEGTLEECIRKAENNDWF